MENNHPMHHTVVPNPDTVVPNTGFTTSQENQATGFTTTEEENQARQNTVVLNMVVPSHTPTLPNQLWNNNGITMQNMVVPSRTPTLPNQPWNNNGIAMQNMVVPSRTILPSRMPTLPNQLWNNNGNVMQNMVVPSRAPTLPNQLWNNNGNAMQNTVVHSHPCTLASQRWNNGNGTQGGDIRQMQNAVVHHPQSVRYMLPNPLANSVVNYSGQLPPGFRFQPRDDELINHYLRRKLKNLRLPADVIYDADVYKYNPEILSREYKPNGNKEWYFFTPREKRYKNGTRPNRAADGGYWKASGKDKEVSFRGVVVGSKRALVFHNGKPRDGNKTNWLMHEYKVIDQPTPSNGANEMRLDDWILCKIYKNMNAAKRNAEEQHQQSVEVQNQGPHSDVQTQGAFSQQMPMEIYKMPLEQEGSMGYYTESEANHNNGGTMGYFNESAANVNNGDSRAYFIESAANLNNGDSRAYFTKSEANLSNGGSMGYLNPYYRSNENPQIRFTGAPQFQSHMHTNFSYQNPQISDENTVHNLANCQTSGQQDNLSGESEVYHNNSSRSQDYGYTDDQITENSQYKLPSNTVKPPSPRDGD